MSDYLIKQVQAIMEKIKRRSHGKNTRIRVLKTIIKLGPDFHKGRHIKKAYEEMFESRFDYLYMGSLVFIYKLLEADQEISHWNPLRLRTYAEDVGFRIKREYFEIIKSIISREGSGF